MYYYSLTRTIDDGGDGYSSTISVSDRDPINCAHMLAAGFNTISRNMMSDFVLAVVHTKDGRVFYDGKAEQIKRDEPWSVSQTIHFDTTTVDPDTLMTMCGGGGNGMFSAFGKVDVQPAGPYEPKSKYEHIARSVLENAYAEMQAVKSVVEENGVETIPLSSGVREMQYMIESRDEQIAAFHQERLNHAAERTAARAEMIKYVKGAYAKFQRVNPGQDRDELIYRWRGMLDVLSKFLVVTGEADADEGHATARRLCGISDG